MIAYPFVFQLETRDETRGRESDDLSGILADCSFVSLTVMRHRNNYLGRRGVIFLTALCLIATPIGSGFTKSWQGLFVCRLGKQWSPSSTIPSLILACSSRSRYGLQGFHRPDFRRRKLSSIDSWCFGHELAIMDSVRYLPRSVDCGACHCDRRLS